MHPTDPTFSDYLGSYKHSDIKMKKAPCSVNLSHLVLRAICNCDVPLPTKSPPFIIRS